MLCMCSFATSRARKREAGQAIVALELPTLAAQRRRRLRPEEHNCRLLMLPPRLAEYLRHSPGKPSRHALSVSATPKAANDTAKWPRCENAAVQQHTLTKQATSQEAPLDDSIGCPYGDTKAWSAMRCSTLQEQARGSLPDILALTPLRRAPLAISRAGGLPSGAATGLVVFCLFSGGSSVGGLRAHAGTRSTHAHPKLTPPGHRRHACARLVPVPTCTHAFRATPANRPRRVARPHILFSLGHMSAANQPAPDGPSGPSSGPCSIAHTKAANVLAGIHVLRASKAPHCHAIAVTAQKTECRDCA